MARRVVSDKTVVAVPLMHRAVVVDRRDVIVIQGAVAAVPVLQIQVRETTV